MVDSISKSSFDTQFWVGYPTASITGTPSVFQNLLTSDYSKIGTAISRASSMPIDATRSQRAGTITYKESSASITTEFKQYNLQRIIGASLFATLNINASTKPIDGSTARPITGMSSTVFTASGGGLNTNSNSRLNFFVDDIIQIKGCPTPTNNVKNRITAVTDTAITVNTTMTNDAVSSGDVTLEVIGHQWGTGVLTMAYASGVLTVTNSGTISGTNLGFTNFGFERGQWIFIGGDGSTERFASGSGDTNYGFARIKSITSTVLTFDLATFTPETTNGTGKGIRLYWGSFVKNRTGYTNIIKTYMALLLQLGHDANGAMSKLILGAIVDEMKFTFPTPGDDSKVSVDTSWVATSSQDRTGTDGLPGSTYLSEADDLIWGTSGNDTKIFKMYKRTTSTVFPSTSFSYIVESDVTIKNNAKVLTATASSEGYDVGYGMLNVSGTAKVAFLNNEMVKDINNNLKFGMYAQWARTYNGDPQAIIMDMPYLDVKTEGVTPKKDDEMMLDVDFTAVRDEDLNKVISFDFFNYLPSIAVA